MGRRDTRPRTLLGRPLERLEARDVPAGGLTDGGFESPAVGAGTYGAFRYAPTGSAWAFSPSAGLSGNGSGFTAGNPAAPQGGQVAFLQSAGAVSQAVTIDAAGSYTLSLQAAQRGNYQPGGPQWVEVVVDGAVVGTVAPGGTGYASFSTPAFALAAGPHTVQLRGTRGGDSTAFVDAVQLSPTVPPAPPPAAGVLGGGFEAPAVGGNTYGAFRYAPTGTAWAFAGQAGVSGNGSGFTAGNPAAPEGTQVGFLQNAGAVTQAVTVAAGSFVIGLQAAQRGNYQPSGPQTVQVVVDGGVVGTVRPAGTGYTGYTTPAFTLAAGTHTVELRGANTAGDSTAFVDAVTLSPAVSPPPAPTPPAAPSGLTAAAVSGSSVRLTWADNANNETGFTVERSPDGVTFTAVGTAGANATTFTDAGLAPLTSYTYRVRATNAAGSSGPSNTATASTPARVVTVATTAEFRAAVTSATPGTRIAVQPGVYSGGNYFANVQGAAGRPVVIAAADPANPPVFRGGTDGFHFVDAAYLTLQNLIVEQATDNGINIDDGDTYATPAHDITLSGLTVRDIGTGGNNDGIKLSGVNAFRIENTSVQRWGAGGGSAVDMVGCHDGVITGSSFVHTAGMTNGNGVQAKGGSTNILVTGNRFENAGARAVQIGGLTGDPFFRPQPLPTYEAKGITVEHNVIVGGEAGVAFVNSDTSVVRFNTFHRQTRYVIRILQENWSAGFLPARNGVFTDNIVSFRSGELAAAVNVGAGTDPGSFTFARNWWWCSDNPAASRPSLPAAEVDGVYGVDPQFVNPDANDLHLRAGSPATNYGAYAP
ncbi:MAG: fibronectin type III domain-containing protein [Gemmataceae bacterium]